MKARVLVMCAVFAWPAWAQDPSFDLKSEAIRNIVRATAATQYGEVQDVERGVVERKSERVIDLTHEVPTDEQPAVKLTALNRPLPPGSDGPISSLIDVLLDVEPDTSPQGLYTEWLSCQQHDDQLPTSRRFETCPGRSSAAPAPGAPTIYTPPVNH